jgi:hypothetical protein
MQKGGAIAILTVMLTGLLSWAGIQVVENSKDITALKTGDIYQIRMLQRIEIKLDKAIEKK